MPTENTPRLARIRPKPPVYRVQVSPLMNDDWATGSRMVVIDTTLHQTVSFTKLTVTLTRPAAEPVESWAMVNINGERIRVPVEFVATSRRDGEL